MLERANYLLRTLDEKTSAKISETRSAAAATRGSDASALLGARAAPAPARARRSSCSCRALSRPGVRARRGPPAVIQLGRTSVGRLRSSSIYAGPLEQRLAHADAGDRDAERARGRERWAASAAQGADGAARG